MDESTSPANIRASAWKAWARARSGPGGAPSSVHEESDGGLPRGFGHVALPRGHGQLHGGGEVLRQHLGALLGPLPAHPLDPPAGREVPAGPLTSWDAPVGHLAKKRMG